MADQTLQDTKAELEKATEQLKGEVKSMEYDGYKFDVDTGLMDDVDALEMIDSIENQNNMKTIIDFLQYLIGKDGYEKMRAHFVEKEGRFKISTLSKIYVAIFEQYDPKG